MIAWLIGGLGLWLLRGMISPAVERGKASWYGPGYHGNTTASGETFNQNAMTAAHKTLPFGTVVVVMDIQTKRKVTVRINDRGPFVEGRIIDLSKAAAERLGIIDKGVADVVVAKT